MVYILELADDEKQIIRVAKENSKNGNHVEALRLFREVIKIFPFDKDVHEHFAWELHKEGKIIFETEKINVLEARKLLAEYIVLKNERPSRLHSLFLKFANKIMDIQEFNFISFIKLWDLNNLTKEDFEPFVKDGNTYSCIAEKIIQHASKLILEKRMAQEVEYILPFVDKGIVKFKDNIWLSYYKAKLLHLINRNDEAIEFLIPVVKNKITEYWAWSLLGDLVLINDKEKALSCYCKSLLCKDEVKFISNVRLKFIELLIQKELWKEAKFEINAIIDSKEDIDFIPDILISYQNKEWFKSVEEKRNNNDFYNSNKQLAEEIIFHTLPWYDGSLGETFTIPEKPDKPRMKLYIKLVFDEIIQTVVSDRKFNTSRNYKIGESIRIKGEYDKDKTFQVYLLEKRNSSESWDIFKRCRGNLVRAINKENSDKNAWVVSLEIENHLQEGITNTISPLFTFKEGLPVFVKYFQKNNPYSILHQRRHSNKQDEKINIFSVEERKEGQNWDEYPNYVGVIDHINSEKNIVHYIINRSIEGTLKLSQLSEKVEVGSKLLLKVRLVNSEKGSYYTTLSSIKTEMNPETGILRTFKGNINFSAFYSFADDVFIDRSLLLEHNINDNDIVSGTAIINFNKKKGTWGWKALKLESVIGFNNDV